MRKVLYLLLILSLLTFPCEAKTPWSSKPPVGSVVDWSHPLSRGLVAVFLMNEGGGLKVRNLADSTFNKYSEILPGSTTNWATSKRGKSIRDTGSNTTSYITLGTTPVSIRNSCSIVMGYRKTDTTNRAAYAFGSLDNGAASRIVCHLPYSDGTIYWDFGNATEGDGRVSVAGLTFGNDIWCFIGSNGLHAIYQNGKLRASNNSTKVLSSDYVLSILGIGNVASQYSDLAEYTFFYMYNRALSPSEIQQLYIDPYCFIESPKPWYVTAVATARRIFMVN